MHFNITHFSFKYLIITAGEVDGMFFIQFYTSKLLFVFDLLCKGNFLCDAFECSPLTVCV